MDFSNRQIVITGGTGALGSAVVGALLTAGARCVVPYVHEAEAAALRASRRSQCQADRGQRSGRRGRKSPKCLTAWQRDAAVGLDPHRRRLRGRQGGGHRQARADGAARRQSRLLLPVLPRGGERHARAAAQGGRIVNVAARPALEWRSGAGMSAYTIAKTGVAALTVGARRGSRQGRHSGQRGGALDHGHGGQSRRHAEGEFRRLAQGRGRGGDDFVSGLARQHGHARRRRAGVWESLSCRPGRASTSEQARDPYSAVSR